VPADLTLRSTAPSADSAPARRDELLHVFAGTCHGFDSLLPGWEVAGQLFILPGRALRRAFYGT
jgi:hypothetical protein